MGIWATALNTPTNPQFQRRKADMCCYPHPIIFLQQLTKYLRLTLVFM